MTPQGVFLRRRQIGAWDACGLYQCHADRGPDPYGPIRRGRHMDRPTHADRERRCAQFRMVMRQVRAGLALVIPKPDTNSDTIRHNPTISDITRLSQRVFIEGMRDRFTRDSALAGFPRCWELDTHLPAVQP